MKTKEKSTVPSLFLSSGAAKRYGINAASIVLLFAILSPLIHFGIINSYLAGVIIIVMINIILATSLNLTTGVLGQIALGHAGFMSVGAYTAALVVKYAQGGLGLTLTAQGSPTATGIGFFLLSLLAAGIVASLFGLLVGIPALRLKGDYLAIITLGFGEIIRVIIENVEFTGGAQGLTSIPRLSNFNLVFWVMVLTVAVLFTFCRSRHGRAIKAIREDDIASEACGVPNTYYKVLAFTISAFFAGIAGAIYAQHVGILGARTFNFLKSIDILVIVVLGGLGSLTGSIVAAIGLTVLPELLRGFSQYRMLVYSLALIVVMIFRPGGLLGTKEFSLTGAVKWLGSLGKRKPPAPKDQSGKAGVEA